MRKFIIMLRFIPIFFIIFYKNELLEEDFKRWCKILRLNENIYSFAYILFFYKEFRNIVVYRYQRKKFFKRYFSLIYPSLDTLYIQAKEIKGGLFIQHGFSTMISAEKIGKNCWINQQVTIGFNGHENAPVIGDDVMITCGSKVLGNIAIGNNVIIGANAVVVKDVEDNSTMVGIPAKKNRKEENMKKILMYCHNGSGNHGCEAIVKSTSDLLNKNGVNDICIISSRSKEDIKYGISKQVKIYDELNSPKRYKFQFFVAYLQQKLYKSYDLMNRLSYQFPFEDCGKETVSLSIGGDNYCYGDNSKYIGFHNISKKYGQKTVLWGCSVEPDLLNDYFILNDLKSFDKIVVRETLSYEAMVSHGLTNVVLYPDPAFTLERDDSFDILPKDNTVGINVSPLITKYENNGLIFKNYIRLIDFILSSTDMNISLIPHVVWDDNDDREILIQLKEYYKNSDRITTLDDFNCKQLKKYISNLRFLVTARTHASIASYSSCIPTLVVGYSVKSKGIAKDIFGTFEHYVVSVQDLKDENELTDKFLWIMDKEFYIKKHLKKFIPIYVQRSEESINELIDLMI